MSLNSLNKNNSAVKRIMQEARELANDPSTDYHAAPLEDDIFEWHCTIRGSPGTDFEGGIYHFRILLPAEYPFRPPSIMMLTPNGRFELNVKICISFTNYHEELWQPAWGVRTAIIGLQGFFPLRGQAAVGVGSIESHTTERKRLATLSREWTCPHCKLSNVEILPDPSSNSTRDNHPTPTSASTPPQEPQQVVPSDPSPIQTPPSTHVLDSIPQSAAHDRNSVPSSANNIDSSTRATASGAETRNTLVVHPPTPTTPGVEFRAGTAAQGSTSSQKPPVLLDTAIMILLVLLFAIICRRVV
ncbi:UBC-like protein [Coprinopsis marcescibilis]|uniref:UBC-like protein n=1 Tax=Coprinopsis marcescibilis TaxID=230819 RepID=A0A5C3L0W9_COPMA|nr:UBC-like protein [Coprinopsis marcescibilis]